MLNRWITFLLVAFLFVPFTGFAAFENGQIWNSVSNKSDLNSGLSRAFSADDVALRQLLNSAPKEHTGQSIEINLPMPNGQLARFEIFESSIMEAELAAKFPELKTYKVYGIDDLSASGRVDISPAGFRGMLQTSTGRVFIDPVAGLYRSKARQGNDFDGKFQCNAHRISPTAFSPDLIQNSDKARIAGSIKVYRMAMSATQEYVNAVGGTRASALAEFNTTINRVNQIYERDLGIRLELVNNTENLIDVDGTSDLANLDNDPLGLLDANQIWTDRVIQSINYDIGHVLSTGGGGIASFGSVCTTTSKAQGVTGLPNPTGDTFYIDYVAHEIGHQFGADHTFNGTEGACSGNRNSATAFEPGSGSTIMGYAGICDAENIQPASEATFHAGSILQINTYAEDQGQCHRMLVDAANPNEPTASAGIDLRIPAQTAFELEGTGTDGDGDTLSYQWNQMDAGASTDADSLGDDLGNNALFRVYDPIDTGSRSFPALGTLLNNQIDKSEAMPCTNRNLNFQLTVRDGKSGQATDDVRITVDSSAGPFAVTSHAADETIAGGSVVKVDWDVAGTNGGVINCQSVDIDLLTFSGNFLTYSETSLASGQDNDGTADIAMPDLSSSLARFRVMCSDNVFFDLSDGNLTVTGTGDFDTGDKTTTFNDEGSVFTSEVGECNISGGGSGGSGATSGGFNNSPVGTGAFAKSWVFIILGLLAMLGIHRRIQSVKLS